VYQVEQVDHKAEEDLKFSGGIYADPEYADIFNFLAQNEWHFEYQATASDTLARLKASEQASIQRTATPRVAVRRTIRPS